MKMTWDTGTHRLVTKARLMLAAPDVVYQALEDYGQHVRQRKRMGEYDEDLELALAGRDHQLIDLALARNAGSDKLVANLYKRSLAGTGDIEYGKAIRLACLANQGISNLMLSSDIAVVGLDEFRRLVREGDFEEMTTLMRNPSQRRLLIAALKPRDTVLNDISDEHWYKLVLSAVDNPGLNTDESNQFGPDMLTWDIHKAIVVLLQTAEHEEHRRC